MAALKLSPSEAKFWEKALKVFMVVLLVGASAVCIEVINGPGSFILFGSLIALAAYYFYKALNSNLANPYFCTHCAKHIPHNIQWKCSDCDTVNDGAKFSLLKKCSQCKSTPKSYICHHCDKVVFLDSDRDDSRPATNVSWTGTRKPTEDAKPDSDVEEAKEFTRSKTRFERQIALKELARQLAKLEASPEFKKEISDRERIEKDFDVYKAKTLGARTLERTQRLQAAELYKDDPELLEDHEEAIDAFVRARGLTPNRLSTSKKESA